MLCTKTITLLWIFLELFVFDHFAMLFRVRSIFIRGISTKLDAFIKHIQTTCHEQEP